MKKYSIKIGRNSLTIAFHGSLKEKDEFDLFQDYQSAVLRLWPSTCTLNLNLQDIPTLTEDRGENLRHLFILYRNAGFRKVKITVTNAILGMQVQRIAQETKLNNTSIIETEYAL